MNSGKEIARLPAEFETEKSIVSPDGQRIIRIREVSHDISTLYLHPVSQLEKPVKLDLEALADVKIVEFLTDRFLLIVGSRNNAGRIEILDLESMTRVASYPLSRSSRDETYSIHPFGSQLALRTDDGTLPVYDLTDGSVKFVLDPVRAAPGQRFVSVNGLRYSSDGKEIVGAIYPCSIAIWTADNGRLILQESVPDVSYDMIRRGRSLEWLPDGSGWLVGGRKILDRKSLSVVWQLKSASSDGSHGASCLLSQDQILTINGSDEDRRMMPVKIAWTEIRQKLALIDSKSAVSLPPGSEIALQLEVNELRTNDEVTARAELTKNAEQMIASAGWSNSPTAAIKLVVRYSETASADRFRGGLFPSLLLNVDPNDAKINTDVKAIIELQQADSGEVLWSVELTSSGGLRVEGERNEVSLRDSAFTNITKKIAEHKLPSVLCRGIHKNFPVVSMLS